MTKEQEDKRKHHQWVSFMDLPGHVANEGYILSTLQTPLVCPRSCGKADIKNLTRVQNAPLDTFGIASSSRQLSTGTRQRGAPRSE
jgi:hypothetical protein